jgi:ABC-2 type transport system ATP-binding protein
MMDGLPAPGSAVRFREVVRHFGATTALDGVDIDIQTGTTVAILGRNGAGKSTAIALMLGLLEPTSGEVMTLGLTPRVAVGSGRVGAMLQAGGLPAGSRVEELLQFMRRIYPNPLALEDILERSSLTGLRRRLVETLSAGEGQRLRFALAITGDPDLMLLDEPTVGMDVEARRSFWDDMRGAAAGGRTILFATHYLEEADAAADQIIVLDHGRVIASGSGASIKARVTGRKVNFILPGADPAILASLPAVTDVTQRGEVVTLVTDDADATVRALLTTGLPVRSLEVSGADLEDAFIALTSNGGIS